MRATKKGKTSEKELRNFYDKRQEDLSIWQDTPVSAQVGQGGGSIVFSIRFSPSELQDLRHQAEARGIKLSEMIRRAAFEWCRGQRVNLEYVGGPQMMVTGCHTRVFSTASVKSGNLSMPQDNTPLSARNDLLYVSPKAGGLLPAQSQRVPFC